jgi:hypothetical protein
MNSFALYLLSLATMIGFYGLYAKFLVPIIEGPPSIAQHRDLHPPKTEFSSQQYDRQKLAVLFPENAWEHGECKVLLTEQGLILFKDFHRVQGGYLEVLPFTLITNTASAAESNSGVAPEPPTVLRCSKGARLKFDDPDADPLSGKSSLESAWLVGVVDIFRPASGPDENDSIEMITSNVQLTKRQIFTIDEVKFAFGNHRGFGRQLSLEFAHQQGSLKPADFQDIIGVHRIELAYLKRLTLIPNSNTSGPSNTRQSTEPHNKLGEVETVDVTCTGPFVLNLNKKTATFNEQVAVTIEGKERHEIHCTRLTAQFVSRGSSDSPMDSGADKPQPLAGGALGLQKLIAEGNPATYFSQFQAAKVSGNLLSYDLVKKEIVAQKSQQSDSLVNIVTPEFHFDAAQVAYKLRPEGGLGALVAQGPGRLLRPENGDHRELLVRWNRSLSIEPQNGQHQISALDGCQIRYDKTTEIQSRQIQVWLDEVESEIATETGSIRTEFQYQPARILATGNVKIRSPQFDGSTERLVANWLPQSNPQNQQTNRGPVLRRGSGLALVPDLLTVLAYNASMRVAYPEPWNQQPETTGMQPIQRPREAFKAVPSSEAQDSHLIQQITFQQDQLEKQYKFKGDEVEIKLAQTGTETVIQDLTATGEVSLTEVAKPVTDARQSPLTIVGHQLRYVSQPDGLARVVVNGSSLLAATVSSKQFLLSGSQIHLDQSANKLWVDGIGQIELNPQNLTQPVQHQGSDPTGGQSELVSRPEADLTGTKTPYDRVTVSWNSGMVFNGRKIYFEDDVKLVASGRNVDGNSMQTSAGGQGVTLELSQQVDLAGTRNDTDAKIELTEAVIVDRVPGSQRVFNYVNADLNQARNGPSTASITHQTANPAGVTLELQQFQAKQITLDIATGLVSSKGPGFLAQHRSGSQSLLKAPGSNPVSPTPAGSVVTSKSAEGLVLVRVNFDGTANANFNEKKLSIRGNVRTLYSSVKSFEEMLDPDGAQALPDDSVKVKSERLEFTQWTPRGSEQPVQELVAAGNAHVTSNSFEAIADQLRYNQATDTLVVEGTGRSDAQLWYQPIATPRDRQHLVAQKIIYRPGDQSTEVQGIKNLDIRK